jgi:hypothetical protein
MLNTAFGQEIMESFSVNQKDCTKLIKTNSICPRCFMLADAIQQPKVPIPRNPSSGRSPTLAPGPPPPFVKALDKYFVLNEYDIMVRGVRQKIRTGKHIAARQAEVSEVKRVLARKCVRVHGFWTRADFDLPVQAFFRGKHTHNCQEVGSWGELCKVCVDHLRKEREFGGFFKAIKGTNEEDERFEVREWDFVDDFPS